MVHSGSVPTAVYGRVVLSPLPFEFALTSLCCQNLTVDEPFVDMLWGFTFMYRCMLVNLFGVFTSLSTLYRSYHDG